MSKAKIMLIDDSEAVLAGVANSLRLAGHDVLPYYNRNPGEACWIGSTSKAAVYKPDLILVDVQMPGSAGGPETSVGPHLVKFLRYSGARVYLCSSMHEDELSTLAARCDADGCVPKRGGAAKIALQVAEILGGDPA